jgi:hypothetical protein
MDCLCYLSFEGTPVKASRLFGGQEHEIQVQRIADHFETSAEQVLLTQLDENFVSSTPAASPEQPISGAMINQLAFRYRSLQDFESVSSAYHQLVADLVKLLEVSVRLVLTEEIRLLYVEGGFAANALFIHFLNKAIPELTIQCVDNSQGAALGALLLLDTSVSFSF